MTKVKSPCRKNPHCSLRCTLPKNSLSEVGSGTKTCNKLDNEIVRIK